MADYETGDIMVFNSGAFGHAGMIYSAGDDETAELIHATRRNGFFIETVASTNKKGITTYLCEKDVWQFRPQGLLPPDQQRLKTVAEAISKRAKYGMYRAVRLELGNRHFLGGAQKRLAKYRARYGGLNIIPGFDTGQGQLVSRLTCSEAVILCYQLNFADTDNLFIRLDAAHAMPRSLAKYLAHSGHWTIIKKP